jgi:hypothetical protein
VATIGIAVYTVRIREKYKDEKFRLGAVTPPFHEMLQAFFRVLSREHAHDEEGQLLQRVTHLEHDKRSFWGIIESGEYGYAAEGINVGTKKQSYQRNPDDAELLPFYFRIYANPDNDTAVLMLQRHGPRGIYSAFVREMRRFWDGTYVKYQLDFGHLVPAKVLQELTEGGVRSIKVVSYNVPSDLYDRFRFLGNMRDPGEITVEFRAKKKALLFPAAWTKRNAKVDGPIMELPANLRPGYIQVGVEYKGKTRTMKLDDPERVAPYIDATEALKMEDTGHPNYTSINRYCDDLMDDVLSQLGQK